MKKTLIVFIFMLSILSKYCYASNPNCEIYINNKVTGTNLYVRFYPIGSIFNGESSSQIQTKYTLKSKDDSVSRKGDPLNLNRLRYLTGLDGFALNNSGPYDGFFELLPDLNGVQYNKWLLLGNDASSNGNLDGLFGYGLYMFEIYTTTNLGYSFDSICAISIDWNNFNYPYATGSGGSQDLTLKIYSLSPLNISFQWTATTEGEELPLFGTGSPPYDGSIKVYKQYHRFDTVANQWTGYNLNNEHPPSRGNSISDENYLIYPLDGRELPSPYTIPYHPNSGDLLGNVFVKNNISTKSTLLDTITNITVKKKAFMVIDTGKTFNMITPAFGYNNLIVEDSAALTLKNEAKIIVNSPNKIILKSQSKLTMLGHSEITIKNGAVFCNEGGYIRGPGKIIYEKGIFPVCASVNDFAVEDSTKIVLLDSAELVLPDNYTLKLTGKESSLIMNPNSKIKFGENSKLVLEGGAGLIAKNAEFTSVDSAETWDGIYLSDISIDTISGCKIVNASGGLNMTNKSDPEESEFDYHTIIENCEFINKTNAEHYNSIFAYNSDKILIRNNHFYSPWYGIGFSNGIYVEYCPSYHFNILENEFDNCGMGISAVHSSPYIAGNDLDGTVSGGYGIFLDNSSSTLKYNKVTYFTYNLVALYSSPSLFKNIFESSDSYSLLLDAYSVPVMNPVIGTNITYWYAGDNKINVSPNSSGIYMTNESYPILESGYNKFYIGDGDYYLSGDLAGSLKEIEARLNYWSPAPQNSYFDFEEDEVIFTPTEDGSSGNRSTNTVQLTDIGFGLSDTLYINDQSDNPAISNLIVEAKNYERVKNYAGAIDSYKEIVSSYDTLYTAFSLHRILDCNEKAGFFSGNYQQAKDYFMSVHNDTLQNSASRNLSKDLYRKVRFRNSELTPVEEDYENLYQNNINNSIGFHALLNKTIIANLIPDTTDNFSGAVTIGNVSDHKKKVFQIFENYTNSDENLSNALTGNNNLSNNYELLQNYPNPFNPNTKITYSIPVSGNISIKIYDLTGKEVKTLVNEFKNAGRYDIEFNGSGLSSGVYFYKIEAGDFRMVKRMVMLK